MTMDLLLCEAPLDNSFQKDRRELVNKGSLGRRRKPTRSNLKNLLSSVQVTTLPPPPYVSPGTENRITNGHCHLTKENSYAEKKTSHVFNLTSKPESSLPRISRESNHVADAQQFSIEAKLKRKKSDASGRSAVLIQTWERRTRTDSFSKRREQNPSGQKTYNRFQNKENLLQNTSEMREFMTNQRFTGGHQNGEALKTLKTVRDRCSQNNHFNKMPVKNSSHVKSNMVNGKTTKHQEPEWISLSRKLCAKYVGEHVESHSADSYSNEEPDGVKQLQQQVLISCPPQKTSEPPKMVEKKKMMDDNAPKTNVPKISEPPWIPLSRRLCTKFIEEHIEYTDMPPVVKDIPKDKELSIEVRPIERIEKPKQRKLRDEPEWISLSRKLRAKFIESHKDDPDTISLENQLNASDPEETSFESLSDLSQEIVIPLEINKTSRESVDKDWINKTNQQTKDIGLHKKSSHPNRFQSKISPIPTLQQEQDCVWEFQEIEFGGEPDPTFQKSECSTQPSSSSDSVNFSSKIHTNTCASNGNMYNGISSKTDAYKFTSFAETAKAHELQNVECYNNDVHFTPYAVSDEKVQTKNSEKRGITIQFVSHRGPTSSNLNSVSQISQDRSPERINNKSPFFNLTTWEEAHYKSDEAITERIPSPSFATLRNEFRSKSVENIVNTDKNVRNHESKNLNGEIEHEDVVRVKNTIHSKWNPIYKSEDFLDKIDSTTLINNDVEKSRLEQDNLDIYDVVENIVYVTEESHESDENSGVSTINDSSEAFDNYMVNTESSSKNGFAYNVNQNLKLKSTSSDYKSNASTSENSFVFQKSNPKQSENSVSVGCETSFTDENFMQSPLSFDATETKPEMWNKELDTGITFRDEKKTLNNNSKSTQSFSYINPSKSNSEFERKRSSSETSPNAFNGANTASNQTSDQKLTGMKKHYKCNGVISNSKVHQIPPQTEKLLKEQKVEDKLQTETQLYRKSRNITTSEKAVSTNEYANLPSPFTDNSREQNQNSLKAGYKSFLLVHDESSNSLQDKDDTFRRNSFDERPLNPNSSSKFTMTENASTNTPLKIKSKSFNDVSRNEDFEANEIQSSDNRLHKKANCNKVLVKEENSKPASAMKFQEFECVEDIPLCAKLVSIQSGKKSVSSISSSNRNTSPFSETSHVYEDMFKEKSTCPSDSETSSWTTMKHNSYYINGRSSSMNELDFSDSCSLSVKCDYASSGSEHSTLQSRHSSCNSSSFYVNLRDYDSHMLEPRKRKDHRKTKSNSNLSNGNPPTPESLRHLFTSPFNGIHSPANRTARVLTRLNQEPESHYYSTATTTSSAFKHGFDPAPTKPKKTERSSSIKIKDIAHGIILTFKKLQNHSKASPTHYVDVSHLAENGSKSKNSELVKFKSEKEKKKKHWGFSSESGINDSDSGCHMSAKDTEKAKARRSSSDLTGVRPNIEILNGGLKVNVFEPERKKNKSGKKKSNARDKGKKKRSKSMDNRAVPTVSRKVQQMADGTLYLVTTVSGDTAVPGVYSDSPDTSSELSSHRPIKLAGESNC